MRDLERKLTDLGADLLPDIDVWPAVRKRLPERPVRRRRLVPALASVALMLVALSFVEPVRSTVAAWFGIGRTTVEIFPGLDPGLRTSVVGEPITAERALEALGRQPRLPSDLAEPDAWFERPDGTVVAVWAPTGEMPEIGTSGAGLLLSEAALVDAGQSVKAIGLIDGSHFTEVGDVAGLWIAGPHVLIPPSGDPESVGNVLLWVVDGIEFRLESALPLPAAAAIAESVSAR